MKGRPLELPNRRRQTRRIAFAASATDDVPVPVGELLLQGNCIVAGGWHLIPDLRDLIVVHLESSINGEFIDQTHVCTARRHMFFTHAWFARIRRITQTKKEHDGRDDGSLQRYHGRRLQKVHQAL